MPNNVNNLNWSQAWDMVRYFLCVPQNRRIDLHWEHSGVIALFERGEIVKVNGRSCVNYQGNIEDVLRRAGAWPDISMYPPLPPFAARLSRVYRGAEEIATARSSTFAKRIANALNSHKPNRRGV